MDILQKNQVSATFFINAYNRGDITSEPYRSFLTRAYQEGHQIASHTYDHLSLIRLDEYGIWQQIQRNEDAIKSVLGVEMPKYIRPPYGEFNDTVLEYLGSWGYKVIWIVFCLVNSLDDRILTHGIFSTCRMRIKRQVISRASIVPGTAPHPTKIHLFLYSMIL